MSDQKKQELIEQLAAITSDSPLLRCQVILTNKAAGAVVVAAGDVTRNITVNVVLKSALIATLLAASGCATYSSNMRVGNDMSYASLGDQRAASQTIQVLESAPAGSTDLGEVDAGRCHRSFVETAPAEQAVLLDLKIAAYALGADVIMGVKIEKQSALTKNCWYMLDGKARALRLAKPDA